MRKIECRNIPYSVENLTHWPSLPSVTPVTRCQGEELLFQSFLSLLPFVFSMRSRVPQKKKNTGICFKIKEKQAIHKCVTKIFHAGLLLSAPSHAATQPPHRSRKPTEEEAPPGQAPALIHQSRCKKKKNNVRPAPHPRNVCRL